MTTLDARTERKIDRLTSDIEDLAEILQGLQDNDVEVSTLIECRDLLDIFANDWDIPVYRRNQAADLVRNVDAELRS